MPDKREYRRLKDGVKVIYKITGKEGEREMVSLDVGARGTDGDDQLLGRLGAGEARREQLQDLPLSLSQRFV